MHNQLRSVLVGSCCVALVAGMCTATLGRATNGEHTITGRIASVSGPLRLNVSDDNGCIDHVIIRAGTIITPTGLKLGVSMRVTIHGHETANGFDATSIHAHYLYVRAPHVVPTRGICR
jgi:hypothetical protein